MQGIYGPAIRAATSCVRRSARAPPCRGLSTTPPAHRPRSWKSSAARWGIATGAVYYYSTTVAYAEEPKFQGRPPASSTRDEDLATVDAVTASRRERIKQQTAIALTPDLDAPSDSPSSESSKAASAAALSSAYPPSDDSTASTSQMTSPPIDEEGGAQDLEEEAHGEGAFNEETGEINWDCPCLGGMAHGPCGPQFREAFSCFVFSKEEPKGIDCVDRFKNMQDCFRANPDVYGAELEEEAAEELEVQEAERRQPPPAPYSGEPGPDKMPDSSSTALPPTSPTSLPSAYGSSTLSAPETSGGDKDGLASKASDEDSQGKTARAQAAKEEMKKDAPTSESDELVPKAWHDAR